VESRRPAPHRYRRLRPRLCLLHPQLEWDAAREGPR
jgi:hypothetical protein